MRSAALCLLAVAAPACNWVFGIETTVQADAALTIDAPLPQARLTWLIAATDALGIPVDSLEFAPISPAPKVQVGRLGQPLMDAAIDDSGTIMLPEGYDSGPWRLAYQLAEGPPREIQWSTTTGRPPHAVVPLFGRLERDPIPGPNTVMMMTPSNSQPTNHVGPIVYTTGVWTQSPPTFGFPSGSTFSHNLNQSVQLSGPPGAPDYTKGDLVLLVDNITFGSCRVSAGSAAFDLLLANGTSTTISAEQWRNSASTAIVTAPAADLVRVGLAASATTNDVTTVLQVGPGASSTMPAFTQAPGAQRAPRLALHGPLMFPMLDCVDTTTALPTYDLPVSVSTFPQLAHLQVTADRAVPGGPRLPHGLVGVRQLVSSRADFDLDVAMPLPPFLLGTVDLSTMDGVSLPAGSDPLVLTFATEGMATSDYFEVLLHRITGTSTEVERIYTTLQPTLTIDRSVFIATGSYVFEVRAFNGAPDARAADFTRYTSTQSSAVVWTHTFVAQ